MNNIKIYLYTRFSLPFWNTDANGYYKPCTLSSFRFKQDYDTYDQYQKYLINSNRLDKKLYFFKNVTLKTIAAQTYQNFEWIIFIHKDLPTQYYHCLQTLIEKYRNIKLIIISDTLVRLNDLTMYHTPKEKTYWSIRIDDDDGLYDTYFESLINCEDNSYSIVGSQECLLVNRFEENLFYSKRRFSYPLSCGLSTKNKHIFSIGPHNKIMNNAEYLNLNTLSNKLCLMSCGDHTITNRSQNTYIEPFDIHRYINNEYQ